MEREIIQHNGYSIEMRQDEYSESPEEWGDDGLFLVAYHRDFTVDRGKRELIALCTESDFNNPSYNNRAYIENYGWRSLEEALAQGLLNRQVRRGKYSPGISQSLAQRIANKGRYEDRSTCTEAKDYLKRYHVFGLEAYIHSGIVLALSQEGNFPDRQWDVSQLGLVFVSREEWKTRAKAREAAKQLIKTWNTYLEGDVWSFTITDPSGKEVDSCGGNYCYKETLARLKVTIDIDRPKYEAYLKELKTLAIASVG